MTDSRDGKTYNTVSYPDDVGIWMAENLNYNMSGAKAYDNDPENAKTFGLLYIWEAAMEACPEGWHLPEDQEWTILVEHYGGELTAGEALKSENGWKGNGNGTNSSIFNVLPAGRLEYGTFNAVGELGFFWSSTVGEEIIGGPASKGIFLPYNTPGVGRGNYYNEVAYSVRCVND